jgi:hypothetical protein
MSKLANQWVEIFEAGQYGEKGSYSAADLDKIVASYDPKKHEAPVVIGHPKDNAPAFGWVESLKREGNKLLAKFRDIVPEFEKVVEQGLFKKRSVSLYGGDAPSLRHVGFLGAMPPHVKALADIKFESSEKEVVFEFDEENATMFDEKKFSDGLIDRMKTMFSDLLKEMKGEKPTTKTGEFSEADKKKLEDDLAAEKKKTAEFEEKLATAERTKKVDATLAKLKAAKKYIPAFDKMGVPAIFHALAEGNIEIEFGEGDKKKKTSAYDLFESFFENVGEIIPMKEIATGARKTASKVIKFTEPENGSEVVGQNIAEYADKLMKEDKTISLDEAYRRARRELGSDTGGSSANAV